MFFTGTARLQLSGGFGLISSSLVLVFTSNRNTIPRVFKDLPAFSSTLVWSWRQNTASHYCKRTDRWLYCVHYDWWMGRQCTNKRAKCWVLLSAGVNSQDSLQLACKTLWSVNATAVVARFTWLWVKVKYSLWIWFKMSLFFSTSFHS